MGARVLDGGFEKAPWVHSSHLDCLLVDVFVEANSSELAKTGLWLQQPEKLAARKIG
jgi:hypothetical protein